MALDYFVQTDAETARVIERLESGGRAVQDTPDARGHRLRISGPPSVEVEEALLATAPSVRRL